MNAIRPSFGNLIFEVTQRCNHACEHCYNVWHAPVQRPSPYPRGEFDTRRTLELLGKAITEMGLRHITLTGGEPLLRGDLGEILEFLNSRDLGVTLISNGRLLTEERALVLLTQGVGLVELPLLSHRREAHDRLSGSVGAFDAAIGAMLALRRNRGRFVAVFVVMRPNLGDLRETLKLAFALGSRGVMLNRFNPGGAGSAHIEELLPSLGELREALRIANDVSTELGMQITCSVPIQPCLVRHEDYPNLEFGHCAVGTEEAYYTLDPLGNIRPCNHSPTILGNLMVESAAQILSRERLAPFVGAAPAMCQPCTLRGTCQGGCKAAAEVCSGSLAVEEPWLARHRAQAGPLLPLGGAGYSGPPPQND